MRKNLIRLVAPALVALSMVASLVPRGASAAESALSSTDVGPWKVVTVSADNSEWKVESYKVGRNLLAWVEISADGNQRKLYSWDGVNMRLLAALGASDWYVPAGEEAFYAPETAGYDAADGLVVWVQTDGHDREIYAFDGGKTYRISDNSYDDRHPITSRGAVAWTSQPSAGGAYNLMHRDASGTRRLATWNVLNYAFSGDRLFWMYRPGDQGFKVYASTKGGAPKAIGDGDDRPIRDYFLTDGNGAAAWEYSTKRWDYDKRVTWHTWSELGAYVVMQKDVPPLETRLEDVYGRRLTVNVKDWGWQNILERSQLLEENDSIISVVWRKANLTKLRYMDGGSVRHRENEGGDGALVFRPFGAGEQAIGFEPVYRDRFDAHGPTAAGARVGTGVVAFAEGKTTVIPTVAEVKTISVRDGDIAWTEGAAGSAKLRVATRTVSVGAAGETSRAVAGFLAKEAGRSAVYLIADNGRRYTFVNGAQFSAYYPNFNSVRTLSSAELGRYQLSGTVLAKPGTRLVKSAANPRVYAVGTDGLLHWVTSASILKAQYGANWGTKLDQLSARDFSAYRVSGYAVTAEWEYAPTVNGTI